MQTNKLGVTIQHLDSLWSQCISRKFHGKDSWKGGLGQDPHHVIHKTSGYSIRWEIENGVLLSRTNHQYSHTSKGQEEFLLWFEKEYPGKYLELKQMASNSGKVDLELVEVRLKDYLNG